MKAPGKSYAILSDTSSIEETRNPFYKRNLPTNVSLNWLSQGWRDLWVQPGLSLVYGVGVFLLSALFIWILVVGGMDYFLLPAMAGFMIIAPLLAAGLYAKSRALEIGKPASAKMMFLVNPATGKHIFFTGLLLVLLMLLWMRSAVLVYALFFGVSPFLGLADITTMLFTTATGWGMLLVGGFIGALFAGFAFAVSVFSIPMLVDKKVDALTAMGTSVALVWNNLWPMMAWGAIVLALFVVCVMTALVGLIIVFPLLGHATWHGYRAMVAQSS